MFVIVSKVRNRVRVLGTFASERAAMDYGDSHFHRETWYVVPVESV